MTSQCPPRAKRTVTHSCTRERATAQHKHVHSDCATPHRERTTACHVWHMSARKRVPKPSLKHRWFTQSHSETLLPSSHVRTTVRSSSLCSAVERGSTARSSLWRPFSSQHCGGSNQNSRRRLRTLDWTTPPHWRTTLERLWRSCGRGDSGAALTRAGLDDARTLANYPRAELQDLQRGELAWSLLRRRTPAKAAWILRRVTTYLRVVVRPVMDTSVGFPIFFPSLRLSMSSPSISLPRSPSHNSRTFLVSKSLLFVHWCFPAV